MKLNRITIPSSRRGNKKRKTANTPTKNKYIRVHNGKKYIENNSVHNILVSLKSPFLKVPNKKNTGGKKVLGIKRFINDKSFGLNFFTSKLDLDREISEHDLETYILNAASVYIFDEPGRFIEDPNDMPPIDKGLSELNLTKEDFKI
jgi:hypothetical protein